MAKAAVKNATSVAGAFAGRMFNTLKFKDIWKKKWGKVAIIGISTAGLGIALGAGAARRHRNADQRSW